MCDNNPVLKTDVSSPDSTLCRHNGVEHTADVEVTRVTQQTQITALQRGSLFGRWIGATFPGNPISKVVSMPGSREFIVAALSDQDRHRSEWKVKFVKVDSNLVQVPNSSRYMDADAVPRDLDLAAAYEEAIKVKDPLYLFQPYVDQKRRTAYAEAFELLTSNRVVKFEKVMRENDLDINVCSGSMLQIAVGMDLGLKAAHRVNVAMLKCILQFDPDLGIFNRWGEGIIESLHYDIEHASNPKFGIGPVVRRAKQKLAVMEKFFEHQ